ncbi:MAG: glutathione S-transferase family protein [Burkholderiales bacterium]
MIDFYGGATPNSRKVAIALLEFGERATLHHVDIECGDQFKPHFQGLNPNGKQPVIVDHGVANGSGGGTRAPVIVWESGAILQYLADKHARLAGDGLAGRAAVNQWLMWQMSAIGPAGGQMAYFGRRCPRKLPLALERFSLELQRLWSVLETHLKDHRFVAGTDYSIADIAIYPWWVALREVPGVPRRTGRGQALRPALLNLRRARAPVRPHIEAWAESMRQRQAVRLGMTVFEDSLLLRDPAFATDRQLGDAAAVPLP